MKKLVFCLCIFISLHVNAKNIIDMYGSEPEQADKFIKKYGSQVGEIESQLLTKFKEINQDDKNGVNDQLEIILLKRNQLLEQIKKEGDFLFVNFNTIFYPDDENQYTTIEVVKRNDKKRLRFINTSAMAVYQPGNDLINTMIDFENLELQLMINKKLNSKQLSCPVFHCVSGFHHKKLKPYLKIFNDGAIKEKKLIVDTLNQDPDPERRAAAAFLMGHFKDPKEIISLLLPHVTDKNSKVRNNVIRVIGGTMSKSGIHDIDVNPFIELLDSPENTDRNKAFYVLLNAAESDKAKKLIIQKGGKKILKLLQLNQPNNHKLAYELLQKISSKNYDDGNVVAWENWLQTCG
ncbi:HEAT repeat domain-containing protein [Legionella spiritensis]|uniref:HEAT repeat protein n=1 Tax=Legionella spiritensis TaxID=452 RepID=A0A0W0YYJ5_LEGSP|nr:HEAT repeat domain-containing protein [Legionella spiritensis]KTD61694.1 hypothetical protein Lspi_2324 [Legionella spiritensis]SNV38904.1 Uncharacterised protein [Legionella spiritensis]